MRAMRVWVGVALVACVMAAGVARAEADPAAVAPKDVLVYAEASQQTAQQALSGAAVMPILKMFLPQIQSRFFFIESALNLPPGTFEAAAPHVAGLAVCVYHDQPLGIVTFDEAGWADKLTRGGKKDTSDIVALPSGVSLLARERDLLIGAPATLKAIAAGGYEPLAKSVDFQAARAAAGKSPVWAYGNVQDAMQEIGGKDPMAAAMMLPASALVGLNTVRYAVAYGHGRDGEGELTLAFGLGANQAGLLGLLPKGAPPMPAILPADASASLTLDWGDPVAFFGGLKTLLVSFGGPGEQGEGPVQKRLAAMEQQWGVKLDDMISYLGAGAVAFLPAPGKDGLISRGDVTVVLLLKDPQKFRAGLEGIVKARTGVAPKEGTFDGTQMYQLAFPPCYMKYTADRLVIGASPQAVNRYLKAQLPKEPPAGPSGLLAVRANLGLLTTSYPKPVPGGMLYLTLRRDANALKLSISGTGMKGAGFKRAYLAADVGIVASMLMPALEKARMAAKEAAGRSNLHQIGLGLAMYEGNHNGKFPANLGVLFEDGYLVSPSVLIDPSDGHPQSIGTKGYKCSYVYAGPLPSNTPPSFIVAYTRKGVDPGGRNVLYMDASVEFVFEDELNRGGNLRGYSLHQQYDWLMKHHGSEYTAAQKAAFRKFYEVGVGPGAGASATSALPRMHEPAVVPDSRSNLHQIGLALSVYVEAHHFHYPPDLEALIDGGYIVSPKVLIDPADKDPQPIGAKGYKCSYEYAGPLTLDELQPSFILAYTRKGIDPGGRNVLYEDNAVLFLTEKQLHTPGGGRGYSLQQQYDWLMKNHGSEYTAAQKAAFRKFYEVGVAPQPAPGG